MEHRAVRLLNRRYDLTNTGYKFLEIRINGLVFREIASHPESSLRTRIVAISRNVKESL